MSGPRILGAILAGERDPVTLARLCHGGVKDSEDTIAKSLEGDYRPEHLFELRQSLAAFHYYSMLLSSTEWITLRSSPWLRSALSESEKRCSISSRVTAPCVVSA